MADADAEVAAADSLAPSTGVGWEMAEQLLSTLREPTQWFESISESIEVDAASMSRVVSQKISSAKFAEYANGRDEFYSVLLKPRKNTLSSVTLRQPSGTDSSRLLNHEEHVRLARLLITFRFMSIVRSAAETPGPPSTAFLDNFPDQLNDLILVPDIDDPATAWEHVNRVFSTDGGLDSLRRETESPDIPGLIVQLFALCVELAERYYKVVKVKRFSGGAHQVEFSYEQPLADRSTGLLSTRVLQRLFRAPTGVFLVHVPQARLTNHYEFRMSPILDRYVLWQRVVYQAAADRITDSGKDPLPHGHPDDAIHRHDGPWVGRAPGRVLSPNLFIGGGSTATSKLFVGVRYEEVPPGASAVALIAQIPSAFLAVSLAWWSLSHTLNASTAVAGILAGLLGVGNIVADQRITSREAAILNAPLRPRALLLAQSALMLVLTLWLLIRGTVAEMLDVSGYGVLQALAQAATIADPYIGLSVAGSSVLITGALAYRWYNAQKTYGWSARHAELRIAKKKEGVL
jgi:hypothetical protein